MATTSNVYNYRMPSGIPGGVTREQEHTGQPETIDATNPPLAYGDFVKMGANGRVQALAAGDTSTSVYGVIERAFPGSAGTYDTAGLGFGGSTPPPGGRCTILKRGYPSVVLQGATAAAKGGAVFVRVGGAVPSGGRLGGVEAAADATPANTIQVGDVRTTYFMGAADSSGNTEIAFNL